MLFGFTCVSPIIVMLCVFVFVTHYSQILSFYIFVTHYSHIICFFKQYCRTQGRHTTFYDGTCSKFKGICHIPMSEPFCQQTRRVSHCLNLYWYLNNVVSIHIFDINCYVGIRHITELVPQRLPDQGQIQTGCTLKLFDCTVSVTVWNSINLIGQVYLLYSTWDHTYNYVLLLVFKKKSNDAFILSVNILMSLSSFS